MKIKIVDDLYDIAWRVKAVDAAYEIFYDTKKNRYEIWADNKLQLAVPYGVLDGRTVELVRKTRVERVNKLMAEMERHNLALEAAREKETRDKTLYQSAQLAKYLDLRGTKTAEIPKYEDL